VEKLVYEELVREAYGTADSEVRVTTSFAMGRIMHGRAESENLAWRNRQLLLRTEDSKGENDVLGLAPKR